MGSWLPQVAVGGATVAVLIGLQAAQLDGASTGALPEASPPPVAIALRMGDANGDGKLQLREYLGVALLSLLLSQGGPSASRAFRADQKLTEQLVPEEFRARAEALLAAKNRHALARQRDFEAEDRDRDGALAPTEIEGIIRRTQAEGP